MLTDECMNSKNTDKMNRLKLWWLRTFKVITNKKAKELGLKHQQNIYGDMINRLNCRSIWEDDKGRTYRVEHLG